MLMSKEQIFYYLSRGIINNRKLYELSRDESSFLVDCDSAYDLATYGTTDFDKEEAQNTLEFLQDVNYKISELCLDLKNFLED